MAIVFVRVGHDGVLLDFALKRDFALALAAPQEQGDQEGESGRGADDAASDGACWG